MIPEYFIYLSIPLSLIGVTFYIRDMFYGKVQPNRVSFLLWSLAPLIGTAIALGEKVGLSVIPVFMAGFSPFLIFVLSFFTKNGYWKLSWLDYVCGALSILALILWLSIDAPVLAFVFAILSDFLAGIPTLIKSWKSPESEGGILYILSTMGNILGLLVITQWQFISYGFSMYFIVMNLCILAGIYQKRLFKISKI